MFRATAEPIAGKGAEFPDLTGLMLYANSSRHSPYNGDYYNVHPRIGIAYADRKISVRAAYGIYS